MLGPYFTRPSTIVLKGFENSVNSRYYTIIEANHHITKLLNSILTRRSLPFSSPRNTNATCEANCLLVSNLSVSVTRLLRREGQLATGYIHTQYFVSETLDTATGFPRLAISWSPTSNHLLCFLTRIPHMTIIVCDKQLKHVTEPVSLSPRLIRLYGEPYFARHHFVKNADSKQSR